jgi:hypothetical protein
MRACGCGVRVGLIIANGKISPVATGVAATLPSALTRAPVRRIVSDGASGRRRVRAKGRVHP